MQFTCCTLPLQCHFNNLKEYLLKLIQCAPFKVYAFCLSALPRIAFVAQLLLFCWFKNEGYVIGSTKKARYVFQKAPRTLV